MSKFSGKCDLYDSFVQIHNYTDEELKNNVLIYIGESHFPLKIESSKDLIPLYPHLISCSYYDSTERKAIVYITSKSFVDIEENESLNFYLKSLVRIYERCKRKKIEFDVDEAVSKTAFMNFHTEEIRELAERVKKYGKKASADGIHLRSKLYYRKLLIDEMIKNGIDPVKYGYKEYIECEDDWNENKA